MVLRRDFLKSTNAVIDLGDQTLTLNPPTQMPSQEEIPSTSVHACATMVIPTISEAVIPTTVNDSTTYGKTGIIWPTICCAYHNVHIVLQRRIMQHQGLAKPSLAPQISAWGEGGGGHGPFDTSLDPPPEGAHVPLAQWHIGQFKPATTHKLTALLNDLTVHFCSKCQFM